MRKLLTIGILALIALPAMAADDCASNAPVVVAPCVAQLANGFEVRHVRREVQGQNVRLYVSPESYTELPASQITGYTADLTPLPAPAASTAPAASASGSIADHVKSASEEHGVDADFIQAVIKAESGANPRAVSRKGAQGLMQLMPATASKLGVKDSFDPAQNVNGGTRYLRELLLRYHGDAIKALAAYNAGPQRVDLYHGVPPYDETRRYVANIVRDYNRRKSAEAKSKTSTKSVSARTISSKGE